MPKGYGYPKDYAKAGNGTVGITSAGYGSAKKPHGLTSAYHKASGKPSGKPIADPRA